jgi:hypothetical protein
VETVPNSPLVAANYLVATRAATKADLVDEVMTIRVQ